MKEWYDLWMKQNQDFLESAQKRFQEGLSQGAFTKPEEHLDQINQWLDELKKHWNAYQLSQEQLASQAYWQILVKMGTEATDAMLAQWMKRSREENPIKNSKELYELWLDCCHQGYQKTLRSSAYQNTYADFLKGTTDFWKSALAK